MQMKKVLLEKIGEVRQLEETERMLEADGRAAAKAGNFREFGAKIDEKCDIMKKRCGIMESILQTEINGKEIWKIIDGKYSPVAGADPHTIDRMEDIIKHIE